MKKSNRSLFLFTIICNCLCFYFHMCCIICNLKEWHYSVPHPNCGMHPFSPFPLKYVFWNLVDTKLLIEIRTEGCLGKLLLFMQCVWNILGSSYFIFIGGVALFIFRFPYWYFRICIWFILVCIQLYHLCFSFFIPLTPFCLL